MQSNHREGGARAWFVRLVLVWGVALGACSGSEPAETQSAFIDAPVQGALLEHLPTRFDPRPYSHVDISLIDDRSAVLRTELELVFRSQARVADLDRLLTGLDGAIVASIEGVPAVVASIPDPGTLGALEALADELRQDEAIVSVRLAWFATPRVLPSTEASSGAHPAVRHHLAVKGHALWNARGAMGTRPHVIVADGFGGGPPPGLDAELSPEQFGVVGPGPLHPLGFSVPGGASTPPPTAHRHGYHVTGIIVGSFGGESTDVGRVTGMLPVRSRLSVADGALDGPLATEYRGMQLAAAEPGPSVLNISLGWGCEGSLSAACQERSRREGGWWAQRVRAAGLEERLLIVVAGGNVTSDSFETHTMPTSSMIIAAAVRDDLLDAEGAPIPALTNTLVVTALRLRDNPDADRPEAPDCLTAWSFVGGDVSAPGEDIYSLGVPGSVFTTSGTSMAAPQVAGLAAALWSVRPTLTPQQLRRLLIDTADPVPAAQRPECSDFATPAPSINAWHAALALDGDGGGLAVRRALLDLDGDGAVGAADLTQLIGQLGDEGILDYGRADLNGDGFTGGGATVPIDLNLDGAADDRLTLLIGDTAVAVDEASVSDLALACYYAMSPLLGRPGQGVAGVEDPCRALGADPVTVTFPAAVPLGMPVALTVDVVLGAAPVEDAHVTVAASGATPASDSGTTNGSGRYQLLLTASDLDVPVVVEVSVTSADGLSLGERTVQATVLPPALVMTTKDARASVSPTFFVEGEYGSGQDDRDEDLIAGFSDTTLSASYTEEVVAGGSKGTATGEAAVTVAFTSDEALGQVTRLVGAVGSSGTSTYTGAPGGKATVYAYASYSIELQVNEAQALTYEVTLTTHPEGLGTNEFVLRDKANPALLNVRHRAKASQPLLEAEGQATLEAGRVYLLELRSLLSPTDRSDEGSASADISFAPVP